MLFFPLIGNINKSGGKVLAVAFKSEKDIEKSKIARAITIERAIDNRSKEIIAKIRQRILRVIAFEDYLIKKNPIYIAIGILEKWQLT